MEYNPEGDFYIVDITEQKEKQENVQSYGKVPTLRSEYHYYLKVMLIWRYMKIVAVVFMATVLSWGFFAQPKTGGNWLGAVVMASVILIPILLIGLRRKVTAKYYFAALGISYALFTIYPPLVDFFTVIVQTLNKYLP